MQGCLRAKIWSSAIPYRSQMSARRPSSTSTPGMITMISGWGCPRWVTDACTSVTCRVSTDQSVKVAEDGGREVLVEVGRHCGYRGGGGSTPRQRRGVDSGRPRACTGGRGIFTGALLGRHTDPSQSRITRGPARSREPLTSISKANDIPGAKRGANGGRRQATPRDVWRRRVQLTGTSSYVRPRPATVKLRLTSEGPQVRTLLRPPGKTTW